MSLRIISRPAIGFRTGPLSSGFGRGRKTRHGPPSPQPSGRAGRRPCISSDYYYGVLVMVVFLRLSLLCDGYGGIPPTTIMVVYLRLLLWCFGYGGIPPTTIMV